MRPRSLPPRSFLEMVLSFAGRILGALLASGLAQAGTLFFTDFEEFSAGANQWGGQQGWVSNSSTDGAQGILQDPVGDLPLGRAAYVGFELPERAFTSVYRVFDEDPSTGDFPIVRIESLLGVQDSTNGQRDRFHLSFFNTTGDFLAALTFDNVSGYMLVDDGQAVSDTGVEFLTGDQELGLAALQVLEIEIDLERNRWLARLDRIPLFDREFTATELPVTLGPLAFEWEIPSGSASLAGDNWLLIADLLVASIPPGPFRVESITGGFSEPAVIAWPGHPGFDYRVERSADLRTWTSDFPGSMILENTIDGPLSLSDADAVGASRSFYRVRRLPSH